MTRLPASWPCSSKANVRDWGPTQAARKFGYTKQRYFQLLERFEAQGALALQSKARGPKTNYRRTEEMVRQIIRHRFLDPDASAEVIAQKLQQTHHLISIRSVERVISDFGLQKKLYACRPRTTPQQIQTQRTQRKQRLAPCDPAGLERAVRQYWPTKSRATRSEFGFWCLSICAWEPGIYGAPGLSARVKRSGRARPCIWCTRRRCASALCASIAL